jgi:hypothetical protein
VDGSVGGQEKGVSQVRFNEWLMDFMKKQPSKISL